MKRPYLARNVRRVRMRRTAPYLTAANRLAARKIQYAYRKYRFKKSTAARARQNHLGEPTRARGQCKTVVTIDTGSVPYVSLSNSFLYSNDLTAILQGSEQFNRERGVVNVSGFKIRLFMFNLQNSTPVWVNVAVVGLKNPAGGALSGTAFFRNEGGTSRAVDFNAVGSSGLQQTFASINTDDYVVLWRKRFMLGRFSTGAQWNDTMRNTNKTIIKYIKYNRQVRWENAESNVATDGRCHLVYWFQNPGDMTSIIASNTVGVSQKCITYFREIS